MSVAEIRDKWSSLGHSTPTSPASDSRPAAPGLSIGQRLTLIVLAAAVPMLLLATAVVWRLALHERDQSRQAILYSSRPIMSEIDAQLGKYMAAVQALAVSQSLKTRDLNGFREEAEQALPGLSGAWVTLSDVNGRQIINTLLPRGELPLAPSEDDRDSVIQAMKSKSLRMSDVSIGPVAKFPMISVGLPILVVEKPEYFLAINVDVTVFRTLLHTQGVPDGWIVEIIDRSGNIVARSRNHDRWVAKPASPDWFAIRKQDGLFEGTALEGQPVIYANAVSQLSGWATTVATEKIALEAPIRRITLSAGLVGLIVMTISMAMAALAARKITGSIRLLETAAQALGRHEPITVAATNVPEVDRALLAFGVASNELLSYDEQRTRVEAALRSSAERLRMFVEQAPASIAMLDKDRRYLAASHRFLLEYGGEVQNVVGRSYHEVSPDMPKAWLDILDGEVRRGENEAFERSDGRMQWVSWEIQPWWTADAANGGIVIFAEDVTERYEIIAALKESEERLRLLINGTKDCAVLMLDTAGHVASWNDGARRITGYEAGEIIGRHFSIFYTPQDVAAGLPESDLEMALSAGSSEQEGPRVTKDGKPIWANTLVNPIYSPDGTLKGYANITRDISERKRAELALTSSETLLRAVADGSPDAIVAVNGGGLIRSINANGVKMFGYQREEVIGRRIDVLVPEPFGGWHDVHMMNYLRAGGGQEVEGMRKDGSVFPLSLMTTETVHAGAPLFVGFLRDLSSRHEIETRIRELQTERLSAMGGLAAGLAHELNQPLTAATTYLETAQVLLEMPVDMRPNPIEQSLARAVDEIMRAGQIMKRLRELVTSGEPDKTFVSLHDFISDTSEFFQSGNIDINLQLKADDDRVLADRIQIKQVFANLIRNAVQAMSISEERTLNISTASIDKDMIRVSVADTGAGFEPGAMERLFEPFRTTKSDGMGIGLSISRMIVEAHYGKIWAESNPAGGAIFNFTLPLVNGEVEL